MLVKPWKRFPDVTRLEPFAKGEWQAADMVRLRYNGKALFIRQHVMNGKWYGESQVFRDKPAAFHSFCRDCIGFSSRHGREQARYHECELCLTRRIDFMLHPCGHTSLCQQCICQMLWKDGRVCCPCCSSSVEAVTKVHEFVDKPGITAVFADESMPIAMLKNPQLTWLKKHAKYFCSTGTRHRR